MEEERKKKKNKKKKGKQTKVSEDVSTNGVAANQEKNHVHCEKRNQDEQTLVDTVAQNVPNLEPEDVKRDSNQIDEVKGISLEEEVRQLKAEKLSSLQHEINLMEEIKQLQKEVNSQRQKEVSLEDLIKEFQNEKELWTLKKASFEGRIRDLKHENESLILKENLAKELTARLTEDNNGLLMKVKELEEIRNSLLQENRQLLESLSLMKQRTQHLETEVALLSTTGGDETRGSSNDDNHHSSVEGATALVQKPIAEKAELVEKDQKMNELYTALDHEGPIAEIHPTTLMDGVANDPCYRSEIGDQMVESSGAVEYPPSFHSKENPISLVIDDNYIPDSSAMLRKDEIPESSKTSKSTSGIQYVRLHENEIEEIENDEDQIERTNIQNLNTLQEAEAGEDAGVPLTDAPLIGAPFRMARFIANYISGADLVNKNNSNSGR